MAVVFGVPQVSADSLTTFLREDRAAGLVLAGCLRVDIDTLVNRGMANLSGTELHESRLKLLPPRDRSEKTIQTALLYPTLASIQQCAAHVDGSRLIGVANTFIAPQKVRILGEIVEGTIIPTELSTNLKSLSPVRVIIDKGQSLAEMYKQAESSVRKSAPDAVALKLYFDGDHRHLPRTKRAEHPNAYLSTAKPYGLMTLDPEQQAVYPINDRDARIGTHK